MSSRLKEITMMLRITLFCGALAANAGALAADSSERNSPVDNNAACMDRNVDASSAKCVVKDDGTPRRTYPPKPSSPAVTPRAGTTGPASTVRGNGSGK
jgi:hypothetical protein